MKTKNGTLSHLWQDFEALTFFNRVMDLFFKLLIFFVLLVLGTGLFRLFWEAWEIMAKNNLKEAFGFTVTSLLTFFIILELFKTLAALAFLLLVLGALRTLAIIYSPMERRLFDDLRYGEGDNRGKSTARPETQPGHMSESLPVH